tara:strand:+ start:423 stop:1241 length:819 start_codon:yes stop_codon:yes gene_type:complete
MIAIGLGQAGCNIVRLMGSNSSVKGICLDGGTGLPLCASHEEYEASVPSLNRKLRLGKEQNIWLIVCGAGKVSGATLAVLEQIKDRNVKVAYIYPDSFFLSKTQTMQNRLVYNVLQEYARSGMIESLYLFSNKSITEFTGEQSLSSLYESINSTISNFILNLEWFENDTPVVGNIHEPKDISRIRTVSVGQIDSDEENLFFPIDDVTESAYYYSISADDKENERNLLTKIRERVTLDIEKEIECSFGLWENQSDVSFFYSIKYTHFIQKEVK